MTLQRLITTSASSGAIQGRSQVFIGGGPAGAI